MTLRPIPGKLRKRKLKMRYTPEMRSLSLIIWGLKFYTVKNAYVTKEKMYVREKFRERKTYGEKYCKY